VESQVGRGSARTEVSHVAFDFDVTPLNPFFESITMCAAIGHLKTENGVK
jgi:hypothetical protein